MKDLNSRSYRIETMQPVCAIRENQESQRRAQRLKGAQFSKGEGRGRYPRFADKTSLPAGVVPLYIIPLRESRVFN